MLQLTMPNMQKAASKETAFAISLVAGGRSAQESTKEKLSISV